MRVQFVKNGLYLTIMSTLLVCCRCSFVIMPADTEVRIGFSTFLNCSISKASGEVYWFHYSVEETRFMNYVYFKGHVLAPYDKRFKIENNTSTGSVNLVVIRAELQDAGRYICQDVETDVSHAAELIVLESQPICISNIDSTGFVGPNDCGLKQDKIQLLCSINYKGNIPPELEWIKVKQENTSVVINSPNCSTSKPTGNIFCNYSADSDIDLDGSHFICQTRNSREAQYNCQTDVIKIHYAVGVKVPITKLVGHKVECSIKTNSPACIYEWNSFQGNSKARFEGHSLTLTNFGVGLYLCKATCRFIDVECSLSVTVFVSYTGDAANDLWLAMKMGIVLNVLLIVSLIGLVAGAVKCSKHHKRLKGNRWRWRERYRDDSENATGEFEKLTRSTSTSLNSSTDYVTENLSYTEEYAQIESIEINAFTTISGIALLDNKVYVVHEHNAAIEVYNSKTLNYERNFSIEKRRAMNNPVDIASSESDNCLYIADLSDGIKPQCRIKRIDVYGNIICLWSVDYSKCRLSVHKSNVIFCSGNMSRIIEFRPTGETVCGIDLSEFGVDRIWHAIKISDTDFAVTHRKQGSEQPRLSIFKREMKANGEHSVKETYSTSSQTCGMHLPISIVQSHKRQILAADNGMNHILLIDAENNECHVPIRDGRINNLNSQCKLSHGPVRMCFSETTEVLFIAMSGPIDKGSTISSFKRHQSYDTSTSRQPENTSYTFDGNVSYSKEVVHLTTIETTASRFISGITVLDRKIYVVHEHCSKVEVFDSTTLQSQKNLYISDFLTNPLDITSSESSRRLYIADLPSAQSPCRIKALDVNGNVKNHWHIDDNKCRLSAFKSNVIVFLANKNQIIEYSYQGEKTETINLTPNVRLGNLFWQAIKVDDAKYAISHSVPESDDHRVSIIKIDKIDDQSSMRIIFQTSSRLCGLNVPQALLQDSQKRILVAERFSNRVQLIDPQSNTCEILIRDGRLKNLRSYCTIRHHPVRICRDESSGKLLVAQGGSYLITGVISIFRVLDRDPTSDALQGGE